MKTRSRIVLGVLTTIGYVLWLSLLSHAMKKPKLTDGVIFEGYDSARNSIREQIHDFVGDRRSIYSGYAKTPLPIELTGEEIFGIIEIKSSMRQRIENFRNSKYQVYWHAIAAVTLAFIVTLLLIIGLQRIPSTIEDTAAD